MRYLPNKKFIFAFVITLLVIGGGVFIFKKLEIKQKPYENSSLKLSTGGVVVAEEIDKDSDNDGLKDWEEALWKTDPNNPDTDNDGAIDGREISENRNPAVSGPNDKLPSPQIPELKPGQTADYSSSAPVSPPTLTETLGQGLLGSYLLTKQEKGNQDLDSTDKSQIVNSVMEIFKNFADIINQNPTAENPEGQKVYGETDIKIYPVENADSVKEYGNDLASIIKKYFDPLPDSELTILNKALSLAKLDDSTTASTAKEIPEEALKELQKLEPIANAYKNTAEEALSLNVPIEFSKNHLALINDFADISRQIGIMQKVFDDPIRATAAISQYRAKAAESYEIFIAINDYFSKNSAVFSAGEPGEFFAIYPKIQNAAKMAAEDTLAQLKSSANQNQ